MPFANLLLQLGSDDPDEVFDAITDIRKQRIGALGTAVIPFLAHPDAELRGAAARAVGDLGLADQEPALEDLATADPDPEVRQGAIYGWSSLRSASRSPQLMAVLERWLRDPDAPYAVRAAAFWGLLDVGGLPTDRWPAPRGFTDIDREVPWSLVEDVVAGRSA